MSAAKKDDDGVELRGRVAHTKELRLYFDGPEARGYSGFVPGPGRMFAVLVLASVKMGSRGRGPERGINVNDWLKAHGWTPPKKLRPAARKRRKS